MEIMRNTWGASWHLGTVIPYTGNKLPKKKPGHGELPGPWIAVPQSQCWFIEVSTEVGRWAGIGRVVSTSQSMVLTST